MKGTREWRTAGSSSCASRVSVAVTLCVNGTHLEDMRSDLTGCCSDSGTARIHTLFCPCSRRKSQSSTRHQSRRSQYKRTSNLLRHHTSKVVVTRLPVVLGEARPVRQSATFSIAVPPRPETHLVQLAAHHKLLLAPVAVARVPLLRQRVSARPWRELDDVVKLAQPVLGVHEPRDPRARQPPLLLLCEFGDARRLVLERARVVERARGRALLEAREGADDAVAVRRLGRARKEVLLLCERVLRSELLPEGRGEDAGGVDFEKPAASGTRVRNVLRAGRYRRAHWLYSALTIFCRMTVGVCAVPFGIGRRGGPA